MYHLRITFTLQNGSSVSGTVSAEPAELENMIEARDVIQSQIGRSNVTYLTIFNPSSFIDGFEEVAPRETLMTEYFLKNSVITFSIVKA